MKISRLTSETSVFVAHADVLKRFCDDIQALLPKLKLTAACGDKLVRSFESFEEFKHFNNPKRSAIQELNITACDDSRENSLSLTLNTEKTRNCRLSIDADEVIAIKLNNLCVDFVESERPWYSWFARVDWYLIVFGGWLVAQLWGLAIFLVRHGNQQLQFSSTGLTAGVLVSGIGVAFLPVLVGVALNLLRNRIFPTGVFALGDGVGRHASDEVIRTVVVAAFAVSVAASLVVTWLQQM